MNQEEFEVIVNNNKVKPKRFKHFLLAFLFGGTVGLLAHLFYYLAYEVLSIDKEDAKIISTLIIILLTTILTISGVYRKLAKKAGAGLFIPTTGFANSVISSAVESRFEGPIFGVGSRMFYLAGSVITYGIVGAFFYALIRLLLSYVGVAL